MKGGLLIGGGGAHLKVRKLLFRLRLARTSMSLQSGRRSQRVISASTPSTKRATPPYLCAPLAFNGAALPHRLAGRCELRVYCPFYP